MEKTIIKDNRELDRMVAEFVLGWEDVSFISWEGPEGEKYQTPILHGRPYKKQQKETVPNYSTSVKDVSDILYLLEGSCFINIQLDPITDTESATSVELTNLELDSKDNSSYTVGKAYKASHKNYATALSLAAVKMFTDNENIELAGGV